MLRNARGVRFEVMLRPYANNLVVEYFRVTPSQEGDTLHTFYFPVKSKGIDRTAMGSEVILNLKHPSTDPPIMY